MIAVQFPAKNPKWSRSHHYLYFKSTGAVDMHFNYVLGIFEDQCAATLYPPEQQRVLHGTKYDVQFGTKRIIFDASDHHDILDEGQIKDFDGYFKFHWHPEKHGHIKNMFPFSPISFSNWDRYRGWRDRFSYAAGDVVLANQRPALKAPNQECPKHRVGVKNALEKYFPNNHDTEFYGVDIPSQEKYFSQIPSCLTSVHVSGARVNMLDRGQQQMMGFGVPTMSQPIETYLSWGKQMIPGEHYVVLKQDHSDFVEKVQWAFENKEEMLRIGGNAQKLFDECCRPEKHVAWIKECVGV